MAGRFPTLNVNVGHVHTYLPLIRPPSAIGIVASAAYPPDAATLQDPSLRVAIRVLDPLTSQLQLPPTDQTPPFKRLPYASSNVDPEAIVRNPSERDALIDAVGLQSAAWGADMVIAPYFHALDPDDPAFVASIALAEATLDRFGPADVLPAVFVHQNALLPQHRDDLLNRLTRTDFDYLYLLVGVDLPSTAPISSDAVLAGIRFVVEVLARNGVEVLWGATDTSGLLAAAWAPGTSYALGPDTFLRRRRQPSGGPPRGGFTPAVRRVFAEELLSELRVPDHETWTRSGRLICTCPACASRGPVDGRLGHYVNAHARLTQRVEHAADPPQALGQLVERAMTELQSGGPSDMDARRHLAHWRNQLP